MKKIGTPTSPSANPSVLLIRLHILPPSSIAKTVQDALHRLAITLEINEGILDH